MPSAAATHVPTTGTSHPLLLVTVRHIQTHPGRAFALLFTIIVGSAFLICAASVEVALASSGTTVRFPSLLVGAAAVVTFLNVACMFQITGRAAGEATTLLRALGASSGQIFRTITGGVLIIGFGGAFLGVIAGWGVTTLLSSLQLQGIERVGAEPLAAPGVVIAVLTPVAASLVSIWVQPLAFERESPGSALRLTGAPNPTSLFPRVLGGVCLLGGGTLGFYLSNTGVLDESTLVFGVSGTLVVLGALTIMPGLLWGAAWLFRWPFGLVARTPARFAAHNLARCSRRAAAATAPLFLGAVLISAGTTLIANTDQSPLGASPGNQGSSNSVTVYDTQVPVADANLTLKTTGNAGDENLSPAGTVDTQPAPAATAITQSFRDLSSALLWVALFMTALFIINASVLAGSLRTQEFGLLRSFGLTRSQVVLTAVLETLFAAVPAILVGLGVGIGLAAALLPSSLGINWPAMVIPASQLGLILGGVLFLAVAATASVTVKTASTRLMAAIRG